MLTFTKGDIFQTNADAIVIPVNCVGVAGAGLAKQAKERWPKWFRSYRKDCDSGLILDQWYSITEVHHNDRTIEVWSIPTKEHWRDKSSKLAIRRALHKIHLLAQCERYDISGKSVAIPALGCGCGEANWNEVRAMIEEEFEYDTPVNYIVYEPLGGFR